MSATKSTIGKGVNFNFKRGLLIGVAVSFLQACLAPWAKEFKTDPNRVYIDDRNIETKSKKVKDVSKFEFVMEDLK